MWGMHILPLANARLGAWRVLPPYCFVAVLAANNAENRCPKLRSRSKQVIFAYDAKTAPTCKLAACGLARRKRIESSRFLIGSKPM
jgi:hypothetical protein